MRSLPFPSLCKSQQSVALFSLRFGKSDKNEVRFLSLRFEKKWSEAEGRKLRKISSFSLRNDSLRFKSVLPLPQLEDVIGRHFMSGIFERNILLNFSFISFSAMSGKISNHLTEGPDK